MSNTSYYLYQKYEQRGSQEPIPVYPNVWSVDGEGTMPKVKKMDNDPNCGYVPPVTTIYRWTNIDISTDYICDECRFAGKFAATYSGGTTYSAACDSSTALTTATTKPSGYDYSAMTTAVIGDCATSIGYEAFRGCESLSSVTIPDSVTTIGVRAFDKCSGLTSINIPSGVTSIGGSAFRNCSGLTSINIPSGVTSIGDGIFTECSSLTSVTIGSGVTSIGTSAFWGCESLTRLNSSVGGVANIPSGVTSIGNSVFNGCSSLTRINIPSGVTSIDDAAFWGCESLTDLTIPDSVTSIGETIINYCKNLNSVTIGNGVTNIERNAFLCYQNSVLSSITINTITPPTLGTGAFNYTNNCTIFVPSSSVDAYKAASGWSTYASRIQAIS